MTDNEKQRVAEWSGWRWLRLNQVDGTWVARLIPLTHPRFDLTDDSPAHGDVISTKGLPKYADLNACAEFEAVAKKWGLEDEYEHAIIAACGKPVGTRSYAARPFDTITATRAQRVKAILRVIGEQKKEPQP